MYIGLNVENNGWHLGQLLPGFDTQAKLEQTLPWHILWISISIPEMYKTNPIFTKGWFHRCEFSSKIRNSYCFGHIQIFQGVTLVYCTSATCIWIIAITICIPGYLIG